MGWGGGRERERERERWKSGNNRPFDKKNRKSNIFRNGSIVTLHKFIKHIYIVFTQATSKYSHKGKQFDKYLQDNKSNTEQIARKCSLMICSHIPET